MSILLIILLLAGAAIVGGLIYLLSLPGKFSVEESVVIAAPPKQVFDQVLDFRSWPKWSPWTMHEPEVELTYSENLTSAGGNYSWDGKIIGAGNLAHSEVVPTEYIKQQLKFTRPFKSEALTEWRFRAVKEGTEVSWIMHSSMPFFFRFMVPMLKKGIANDYKLGLRLLAQTLDAKADKLKFDFVGITQVEPRYGLYESFSGKLQDLPPNAAKAFEGLEKRIKKDKLKWGSPPFNAYWKVNMKRETTECDFVWPVTDETAAGGKSYPAGKYFRIEYQGPYQYLEQAWNSAMAHVRMKKLKLNPKLPSLEVYENDPRSVKSPNELKTAILIPVK